VSYGISSRVAIPAVERARADGRKVGSLRLVTVWPFPENRIRELAPRVKSFVIPEINYGQLYYELERCAAGKARTILVPHGGGWVHDETDIYDAIKEGAK
jgi:2-oxoglutarate ferredoxin oxidoreductase subunit alpha